MPVLDFQLTVKALAGPTTVMAWLLPFEFTNEPPPAPAEVPSAVTSSRFKVPEEVTVNLPRVSMVRFVVPVKLALMLPVLVFKLTVPAVSVAALVTRSMPLMALIVALLAVMATDGANT